MGTTFFRFGLLAIPRAFLDQSHNRVVTRRSLALSRFCSPSSLSCRCESACVHMPSMRSYMFTTLRANRIANASENMATFPAPGFSIPSWPASGEGKQVEDKQSCSDCRRQNYKLNGGRIHAALIRGHAAVMEVRATVSDQVSPSKRTRTPQQPAKYSPGFAPFHCQPLFTFVTSKGRNGTKTEGFSLVRLPATNAGESKHHLLARF